MSSLLSEVSFLLREHFCCFQHKQQKLANTEQNVTAENLKLVNHQIEQRPKPKWLGSHHSPVKFPFLSDSSNPVRRFPSCFLPQLGGENKCGGQEIKQPLIRCADEEQPLLVLFFSRSSAARAQVVGKLSSVMPPIVGAVTAS
jgi:hypothetical protein